MTSPDEDPLHDIADSVDPKSSVPLHVQIRRVIRRNALDGVLVDRDGRLKTEAELGALFGVSRITIRTALQPLVEEGLFWRTRGKGTFRRSAEAENWSGMLKGFVEIGQESGFETASELLEQGMTKTFDAEVGAMLGERAVFRLRRLRLADGTRVAIDDAYYPPDIGLDLQEHDLQGAAIYRLFEDSLGLVVKEAHQALSATIADDEQAGHLGIRPGDPLILVDRLTTDIENRPLEFLRSVFVPQRYRFLIKLSRRRAD